MDNHVSRATQPTGSALHPERELGAALFAKREHERKPGFANLLAELQPRGARDLAGRTAAHNQPAPRHIAEAQPRAVQEQFEQAGRGSVRDAKRPSSKLLAAAEQRRTTPKQSDSTEPQTPVPAHNRGAQRPSAEAAAEPAAPVPRESSPPTTRSTTQVPEPPSSAQQAAAASLESPQQGRSISERSNGAAPAPLADENAEHVSAARLLADTALEGTYVGHAWAAEAPPEQVFLLPTKQPEVARPAAEQPILTASASVPQSSEPVAAGHAATGAPTTTHQAEAADLQQRDPVSASPEAPAPAKHEAAASPAEPSQSLAPWRGPVGSWSDDDGQVQSTDAPRTAAFPAGPVADPEAARPPRQTIDTRGYGAPAISAPAATVAPRSVDTSDTFDANADARIASTADADAGAGASSLADWAVDADANRPAMPDVAAVPRSWPSAATRAAAAHAYRGGQPQQSLRADGQNSVQVAAQPAAPPAGPSVAPSAGGSPAADGRLAQAAELAAQEAEAAYLTAGAGGLASEPPGESPSAGPAPRTTSDEVVATDRKEPTLANSAVALGTAMAWLDMAAAPPVASRPAASEAKGELPAAFDGMTGWPAENFELAGSGATQPRYRANGAYEATAGHRGAEDQQVQQVQQQVANEATEGPRRSADAGATLQADRLADTGDSAAVGTPSVSPAAGAPVGTGSHNAAAPAVQAGGGSATAAAAAAASDAAPGQAVPMQRVSTELANAVGLGNRSIRLRVAPPGLGELAIDVRVSSEGRVQMRVAGEAEGLASALRGQADQLQASLRDQGLSLETLDFRGGASDEQMAPQQRGSQQDQADARETRAFERLVGNATPRPSQAASPIRLPRGEHVINVLA